MDILFLKLQRCVNVHAASVVVKLMRAINDLVFGAAQLTTWSWFRSTTCFELKPFHNFPRTTHTIRLQLWSSQLIHCISSWLSWYRPYHRIDTSYSCYVCYALMRLCGHFYNVLNTSLTNHLLLHSFRSKWLNQWSTVLVHCCDFCSLHLFGILSTIVYSMIKTMRVGKGRNFCQIFKWCKTQHRDSSGYIGILKSHPSWLQFYRWASSNLRVLAPCSDNI